MSNPKRNDLCPCGSGRKYKKCCGASNVVELSPELYNTELESLHEKLLEYTITNYEDTIENIYLEHPLPDLYHSEALEDVYMSGLIPWIILHEIPPHKNQTIYEAFYKKQQSKIKRTRTNNLFQEWANSTVAVYEILPMTNEPTNTVALRDVITNKTYEVKLQDDNDYDDGNILIAVLLPFANYYHFLFETIEINNVMKEKLIDLTEEYIAQDGNLMENYPEFLVDALTLLPPTEALEWKNPVHEMVAAHFANNMHELEEMEEDIIQTGILLWYFYCEIENPSIKKLGPYAASIEYIVLNRLSGEKYITQSQLAKDYDTSTGSISKIVQEIETVMNEEMEDFMDKMEEEFEEDDGFIDHSTSLENTIHDIQKIMEEQDFESEEEMNAFLDQLLSSEEIPSPSSNEPRYIAQEKLDKAQQIKGPKHAKKREKLIKEALEIHPNNPDAFLLLSNDAKSFREYHHLVHQAVIAGKKDLGEEFFKENKGYFWGLTETRPFMRAKAIYGSVLYEMDLVEEAINEFEEMLDLNPNDNQGIRDTLLLIYMEEEQFKKAQQLMRKYEKDGTATFSFSQALVHYLTKGMTNKTKTLLKAADKQNPYVKDYLLDKKEIPDEPLQYVGFGDDSEAIAYAQDHFHLWLGENELLDVLAKL